ncbi:MAG: hypothetical protein OTI36_10475 [Beijerinckiaceae bacterium]|nr:hypothetical protein [Beijerinckiaceae bacterium]
MHPKLVLLLACLAPGLGHAALGRWSRAVGFAAFTQFFAALTWKLAPHDRSLVGRTAAGLFVWALSIPDAYRSAVLRERLSKRPRPLTASGAA